MFNSKPTRGKNKFAAKNTTKFNANFIMRIYYEYSKNWQLHLITTSKTNIKLYKKL